MKRFLVVLLFIISVCVAAIRTEDFDKWIVVTTIQYPTPAVEKLAKLPGWKMVVVGDKKTPSDWHLDGCDYLSPQKQMELGYETAKVIPWNHYARKNIGYLYALEHGAKVIYETDDDNYIDIDIELLPENIELDIFSSKTGTVNPYAIFGRKDMWPRGYPLEHIISNDLPDCKIKNARVLIQQGLINGDTDVDAIFRLTRESDVRFDKRSPMALAHGTMTPFNTQNTCFYYDAFWALLVPMSVAFRVCDIWRGYIMQRLLWDINGYVSFFATDVVQYRNEHNLLNDFKDEIDLYTKSGDFIKFLSSWRSSKNNLLDRFNDLFKDAIDKHFFKESELSLVNAWINDLTKLGYLIPPINATLVLPIR
jgi:hypothetical protein